MPHKLPERYDVIVLGGGAAGLMCAMMAGKRGRKVLVLERAERIGKKILISGGGRCNFTNVHCKPENFISNNPHFCKSALARYTPANFISLVEKHRIAYHEKTLGQLFCDGSAQEIVTMLEQECRGGGVRIIVKAEIDDVRHNGGYRVRVGDTEFQAAALVVATGGLSIPKMGATSFGYELAQKFGVAVRECKPGLVPLVLSHEDRADYCELAGVSTEVIASAGPQRFREKMLFTHRGLSGPAILQISSYWRPSEAIEVDLAPDCEITAELIESGTRRDLAAAKAALRRVLPIRLADRWLERHAPAKWRNSDVEELERAVHHWKITPQDTEGYVKAEVTAGGVDTDELSAKTMECRNTPGLFFVGEVVDVTGHLGGFNFQWAWASGYSAGQAV